MKYDLISIGDPTVDTFLKIHDAHVACKLNRIDCQICVRYGDKIAVDEFFRYPAGNMPNNAISASRLGLKVAAFGMVGRDSDGDWIRGELKREGVDTHFMRVDEKNGTNSSTVLVFQGERTIFIWHQTRRYELPILPQTDWVYFTSAGPLGEHVEHLHKEVLGYLKTHSAKLGFNPGTYQLEMGRDALSPFFKRSEVVFLNKEETQFITGKKSQDIKVLLRALKELGPRVGVVTDGPNGSFTYDGQHAYACGILDFPVVERTGAGDAYASAFLSAQHYGHEVPEAMRWGTINSSYKVGRIGGILGLPTKEVVEKTAREHPELKVKEI